jgi:hypothetical protein
MLATLLDIKGKEILHNIKTCWISMLFPHKHVVIKYKTLIIKMCKDQVENEAAISNV